MAHGAWCSISVHMCGIPMVQHFRAHVWHAHGAERTRTYRAHTRVHVHIPCTYTPSACISDFDMFLNISSGSEFVVSARPGSYALEVCLRKRQKSKVGDLAKLGTGYKFTGVEPRE